jgi:translation initiation factor IF-2
MMSILEYADDVSKSVEEIFKLCDRLEIKYTDENTDLSEDDIVLLDGEVASSLSDEEDTYEEVSEEFEERLENEALEDHVEEIVNDSKIKFDNSSNKQKFKSKADRVENSNKAKFQKDKKELYKHREKLMTNDEKKEDNIVLYKDNMTVTDLANLLGVSTVEIIKKLMKLGIMANINYALSFEVAELIVIDYGKELKEAESKDISNFEKYEINDNEENLVNRPPIVTVMGHVDHGKTSLLDKIRQTDVVSGEAGGITQAIGAYQVECNGNKITFIDTPGHEAFTEMRARGASVTDVVIIIVAADDGVKPQTKEAIDHAKAANVPILVAINKIDKPEANIERVMQELTEYDLAPEAWGGSTIYNNISCKTGEGIDKLLENILLVSEMGELKANPSRYATGTVIESRLDKSMGGVASILIQNGTLRIGDPIVVGTVHGRVRTMKSDLGKDIVEAGPSMPVEISGLTGNPGAGDRFMAFESEKEAKQIAEERQLRAKKETKNLAGLSLEDLFSKIQEGQKEINVVLKADVNGSLEAVKNALEKIDVEGVKVKVIRGGVGAITESDVVLASASNALIIGFNVRANNSTSDIAKEYNIDIKTYDIIYKVVEDMEAAMKGMLDPEFEEKVIGTLEIRQIFKFSKVGLIAGCHVTSGVIKSNSKARLIRDDIVIYNGAINSLQHEKEQVKEMKKDMDCGITLENYQDIKEGDIIETYDLVEVKRK